MHLDELIHQKKDEKIIFALRRHPLTFVPIAIMFAFLLFVPIAIFIIIYNIFPDLLASPAAYPLLVLAASAYYLYTFLFFTIRFLEYYLDLWTVTNKRIVDIEQHGLFSRTTTELELHNIQDVTVEQHGVFATFFNYGDVHVKTASLNTEIIFFQVKAPNDIRKEMIKLTGDFRNNHHTQPTSPSAGIPPKKNNTTSKDT